MFQDPSRFPFTAELERDWRRVRAELDALPENAFFDWYEAGAYSGTWRVCGLWTAPDHPGRDRLDPDVVRRCPATVELVRQVPEARFGAFSWMGPRAIIHPHQDGGPALRCHLGLRTPHGCRFRVGDEDRPWEEGRCLVFDGRTRHAAWNHADAPRVVLLVEFAPPR